VEKNKGKIKIAMPKGRLFDKVNELMKEAGFDIVVNGRSYRPYINDPQIEVKLIKPQNIPKLVELGSQDVAFTGHDWITEEKADVVELIDLGFNPVSVVAAIQEKVNFNKLKKKKIRVVSEYENLTKKFLKRLGSEYVFIKSFGATEVFIPEDADMMIDNISSGKTLENNNLKIVNELLKSSTRMIANKQALKDPFKKKKIEDIIMMFKGVFNARDRVFMDMNISRDLLDKILPSLPAMKSPTVSELYDKKSYSVKIVVKKSEVNELIPRLKKKGVTDILVFNLEKVIP